MLHDEQIIIEAFIHIQIKPKHWSAHAYKDCTKYDDTNLKGRDMWDI